VRLFCWLSFALFVAAIVAIAQRHHSYFFEVNLVTSRAETARIYYDSLRGTNASTPFQQSPGSSIYRLPLPTGITTWLHFAPLTDEGTATFSNARIVDRKGKVVQEFHPKDFRPLDQIAHYKVVGDKMSIETVPQAATPKLDVSLPGPLQLRKLDFDLFYVVAHVLLPFLVVFFGGLAAGIVPGLYTPPRAATKTNSKSQEKEATENISTAQTPNHNRGLQGFYSRHRTALVVIAAGLVLFLRMPDRFINAQLWAEDALFFTQALEHGVRSLFMPYGGYQLLMPRIAEFVATQLPLEHVPLFLNLAALAIALTVVSRFLSPRCHLPFKPLLALAIVFVPRPEDIFLTIENVQWVMSLGLVLLVLSDDPRTISQYVYDSLAAVLSGLTGVFSVLFLPLFALRLWQRRNITSAILFSLVLVTASTQIWFVAHAPQLYAENAGAPFDYGLVPVVLGYQLVSRLFFGEWMPYLSLFQLGVLGSIATIYWGILFFYRGKGITDRLSRNILLLAFGIALAASVYRFKNVLFIFTTPEHIARYFFPTQMLFIWLLLEETTAGLARRTVAYILLFAFLSTSLTLFRVEPLWDYDWKKCVAQIRQGENVAVPVNPPGWYFQYPGKPGK
jgi:hypothetical protein